MTLRANQLPIMAKICSLNTKRQENYSTFGHSGLAHHQPQDKKHQTDIQLSSHRSIKTFSAISHQKQQEQQEETKEEQGNEPKPEEQQGRYIQQEQGKQKRNKKGPESTRNQKEHKQRSRVSPKDKRGR